MLGVQTSPEALWKGRGSLQAKGRKLEVAFFLPSTTTSITTITDRPCLPSASSASLRLGIVGPRPGKVGDGSAGPKRRRAPFRRRERSRSQPCSFFFLFSLFSFNSSSVLFVSFFIFFFLLSYPRRSPLPARPSVGENQVGDAGLEPVSRDHLAHLGRAVVRELEVRAGAGLEVKIQVPVERRRRAEAAQGHALKV